ncbi:hypothetical protein FJZ19_02290 [Candidatus Pacearchaeota archaeon]|nr:hypothetical protein [Candidatus Pacearchaeota archaeon]
MKKSKIIWIFILVVIIIAVLFIRFIIGGDEDDWIKDSRGVWIKHGNPAETPAGVSEQQTAISCALNLYKEKKNSGMQFSSQCLGNCGDYAIDVVHVPRTDEDNIESNICSDFREARVNHFIELDKNGEIVRIV